MGLKASRLIKFNELLKKGKESSSHCLVFADEARLESPKEKIYIFFFIKAEERINKEFQFFLGFSD